MLRAILMTVVVLFNFILQSSLWRTLEIFGVIPNTALIIVISYAIVRDDVEGAMLGFFAGLLPDVFYGSLVGLTSLLFVIIGYLAGKPFRHMFRETVLLPLVLVAVSTVLFRIAWFGGTLLLEGFREFDVFFSRRVLPELAYTLAVTVPIYKFIRWLNKRLDKKKDTKSGLKMEID